MNELFQLDWVLGQGDEIWIRTKEHLELTFLAVVIGFAISLPLGLLGYRYRSAYGPITWITGFLYTIPSLALFGFLIPVTGLSTTTAEIGLVSYTLLILVRNIVGGLNGVPGDVKEAAVGMGHDQRQLLWKVEIPLAVPVIIAGLRIALVTTIGLVTVTALVGQGGYGYFILRGLRLFHSTGVILGSVMSIALAVAADQLLLSLERRLTPWAAATRSRIAA